MEAKSPSTGLSLVTVQMALVLLIVWPWDDFDGGLIGVPILLAGVALGLWSLTANRPGNFNLRPELKANAQFVTWGPYAHVRHPMYTAVLLVGLGFVIGYLDVFKLVCWIILLFVLRAKARLEEEAMAARFPGYRDYAAMTGAFLPKVMLG